MLRRVFPPLVLSSRSPQTSHLARNLSKLATDSDQNDPSLPFNPYAFVQILNSAAKSSSLSIGEQSHSSIIKHGFSSNVFVNTALLDVYFKCYEFRNAQKLFDEMPERNVVTWNTLIHGHSQSLLPLLAIEAFITMVSEGISPTPFSVSSVLTASSRLEELRTGIMLHCMGFKHGFCSNVVVSTALVDMYSKCSDVSGARRVFDEMEERNVITWTSLVNGYSVNQRPDDAMILFKEMRSLGVRLNNVTYNSLLSSFSRFQDLVHGKQVHSLVIREGLDSDPFISVTLVTLYSKCGSLEDFVKLCPTVSTQDQISCNSVIAGFSHLGDGRAVLERFSKMRRECIEADLFTFASVLRAIGILSALEEGRQTHALIFKTGHYSSVCVQNGLLSMYAKCGEITDSKKIFALMSQTDLVSWNSLLSGCAQHGFGKEAVELFEEMRGIGVIPDHTTFLCVLSACSHVGLVEKGLEYFYLMKQGDSPVAAGVEHHACVVDLLCRAGYVNEAESFINNMPIKPGISVYRALLSACQIHRNVDIAKRAARCLLEICPNDPSTHVLLANVFAADECWENAAGVRKVMQRKGISKQPAWSLIEDRTPLL